MKNFYRVVLIASALLFAASASSFAQKWAHIDANSILTLMAQKDSVSAKVSKLEAALTKNLEDIQVEYNRKYDEYQKNQASWTELVRKSKEADLVQIQQKSTEFREVALEELQNKEKELMAPIQELLLKTITDVAKAQNLHLCGEFAGTVVYLHRSR